MSIQAIGEQVYEVGASHSERQLYEDFLPLPHGTTYNAYLVVGERASALIDTVPLDKPEALARNLSECEPRSIDYIVVMRDQEDFAQSLPYLLQLYPAARVVCTERLRRGLLEQVDIDAAAFVRLDDGERLDLGGKSLRYHVQESPDFAPIHSLYLEEDGILFSGLMFSSHYADANVFATFGRDEIDEAKRYFAAELMCRRGDVRRYLERWEGAAPRLIAPLHGPIWQEPGRIFAYYRHWLSELVKPEVVIAYVSVYGHTRKLVEKLMFGLVARGISVICRDIAEKPASLLNESTRVLGDLVNASTLIVASSTKLSGPHPAAAYLAVLVSMMQPKTALFGFAGSKVGPSSVGEKLAEILRLPEAERLPDLFVEGKIDAHEADAIAAYAEALAERIRALPNLAV